MALGDHVDFSTFMEGVKKRNPHQPEFVQAVEEVAEDIFGFIEDKEAYHSEQILRRIAEPDPPVVTTSSVPGTTRFSTRLASGRRSASSNAATPSTICVQPPVVTA